jgi:hypothetical protein
MPSALTLPADIDVAPDTCVWEHVARAVAWLDQAAGRDPHDIAVRVMKVAEEAGEAVAAYIVMTGSNPRKPAPEGATEDFTGELCDVVLAGLVALATVTGGTPQAEARLARHVATSGRRLQRPQAVA